jgi:CRP-like cAMP-binding protein
MVRTDSTTSRTARACAALSAVLALSLAGAGVADAARLTGRQLVVFEQPSTARSSSALDRVLDRAGVARAGRGVPRLGVATVRGPAAAIARLRRDPSAALDFAKAASARLLETYQRLESLSAEPAMGRLARALLDLASDLGQPAAHGIQIRHHITQEELGRLISARREVVSSLLNELRKTGLISYTRRGYIVVDRDALQDLLESINQA